MFKKKPIYIVGIILFSLILVADCAIFFFAPDESGTNAMPQGFDASQMENMRPEGFDAEDFNAEDFSGQMPEGFSGGQMPEGFGGGQMPEGFSGGEMPEGFGGQMPNGEDFNFEGFGGQMPQGGNYSGGELPEDFDSTSIPKRGQIGDTREDGLLSTLRSAFWPVLIVSALLDGLCIVMLILVSKKQKKQQPAQEEPEDEPFRRGGGNLYLGILAIFLVGAVVFTGLPSGGTEATMEAETSIEQAEADYSDIAAVFTGSGTLTGSEAQTLELSARVKITSYSVQNGDVIQAGDVLATADRSSVMNALYEVQTLLAQLDTELAEVQSDTFESEVTARASGRVKAIYVAAGDSVDAAMYDHGAVALLSLGGSMTVEIESETSVAVGQALVVTLSDGTQVEGKVQQLRDGIITLTTTDDGPAPDDTVTVSTEEGSVLGSGVLSISSPMKVTGFSGTVESVAVEVGDAVEIGDTLLTLENNEDRSHYEQLLRQREELTAMQQELMQIYQDGVVKAKTSGIVSGVKEIEVSAQPSDDVQATGLAANTGSYGITLLSHTVSVESTAATAEMQEETAPSAEGTPDPGETAPPPSENTPPDEAPSSRPDGSYAGLVSRVCYGVLEIKLCEQEMSSMELATLKTLDEALFTSEGQYAPAADVPTWRYSDGQSVFASVNELQAGDRVLLQIENGAVIRIDYVQGSGTTDLIPGGNSGGGSFPTQGDSGFPSQGSGGSSQMPSMSGGFTEQEEDEEEETVYEVEITSLCVITPAETMTIAVSVDELDILSLSVGQEADISLDALPGQSFTGFVKKISTSGSNEGGSTKYTVTMEVPRTEQMLDGMNAAVRIEVSRLSSVLTVPAAAIIEDGGACYVYTAVDEAGGELKNPVEVTTGASDGTLVEILSGLSAGDTVYYAYADSIVYRSYE